LIDQGQRVRHPISPGGPRRRGRPARADLKAKLERGEGLGELVVKLVREEASLFLLRHLEPVVEQPQPLVGEPQLGSAWKITESMTAASKRAMSDVVAAIRIQFLR
jgi:hypothetical protein